MTVRVDSPGVKIDPALFGIFFEEINCAGDGGIYAEMVRNRSFEESGSPVFWNPVGGGSAKGEIYLDSISPVSNKNPHSLKLRITQVEGGSFGVANEGYWGMALKKGEEYILSFYAKCSDDFKGPLTAVMEGRGGRKISVASIDGIGKAWKQYSVALISGENISNARLVIGAASTGTVWLDVVSLFPKQTFYGRQNGLRQDLAQMLYDLRPGFVRFPGGCWVEGDSLNLSYRWKKTIGEIGNRWTQYNIWQYYSTNGLGFHEYLQMCEDFGAEPLFVINCGMSHRGNVPMEEMDPWVQDALDAIEYANGPVESTWGELRAKNGHPKPFNLRYMEIGNENGGPAYHARYALFYDAIKAKYPGIRLIADVWGGYPGDRPVEMIDEHYYSTPNFFINNANRYDTYDRKGPKIYVGEYAVTQGCGNGNLRGALGEAAFMTGLERNADIVALASYAPLFANVNYKKWNPDLINFNSSTVYGTPSYYVQKMFSENRGDVVLPLKVDLHAGRTEPAKVWKGKIGLGTWMTQAEYKDIRVIRGKKLIYKSDFKKNPAAWKIFGGDWKTVDGAFRQIDAGDDRRAYAGDVSWRDYTYSLKARKLGGAEGFLIMFLVRDDDNWLWWNIGGWGNTKHTIELCEKGGKSNLGKDVPGSVETGRWYDVRVDVRGDSVRCFLDGKLIHDAKIAQKPLQPLHAVASRKINTGEIILKVVNVSKSSIKTTLNLEGISNIQPRADAFILTSRDPLDENSIAEPMKVVPVTKSVNGVKNKFTYQFAANSLTVLRIKNEE